VTEAEGLYALWYREFKVFTREKSRVASSLFTPFLWITVFGGGLGSTVVISDLNYQLYIFPGIVAMTVLFSAVFFGLYIVWDKKIDFFKEVLVAPLSRVTIFTGKMLGGCTEGMIQGAVMLSLGLLLGVTYNPYSVVLSFLIMFALAAGMVSVGLIIGYLMESLEGFNLIISFLVFPLFFLSGALFPIENLPGWLTLISTVDPVTYAVDGLRGAIFGVSNLHPAVDLGVLLAFSLTLIAVGVYVFRRVK